jgi:hypothetical protein
MAAACCCCSGSSKAAAAARWRQWRVVTACGDDGGGGVSGGSLAAAAEALWHRRYGTIMTSEISFCDVIFLLEIIIYYMHVESYLINHLLSKILGGRCFVFLFRQLTEQPYLGDMNNHTSTSRG